jgi:hypothetical protein
LKTTWGAGPISSTCRRHWRPRRTQCSSSLQPILCSL